MTNNEFQAHLQTINPDLHIVPHPSNDDVSGVYYKDAFLATCPSGDVYEERKATYTDAFGNQHRTVSEIVERVEKHLEHMDDDYYDLLTEEA